jgi:hypothetical protein
LLLTICAVSGHVEAVVHNLEPVFLGQALFESLNVFVDKLHDFAAVKAAQMTVMSMAINGFVVHMAVFVPDFPDETAFHNKGNIAINGSLGDPAPLLSQPQVQFVHVEMAMTGKYLPNDLFPLRRIPQPFLADERPEKINFVSHHHLLLQFSIKSNRSGIGCQYLKSEGRRRKAQGAR